MLSEMESAALTATGEIAFLIVGKASLPDDPTRWILHLVPVPMATAAAACEVAQGLRKPGKRVSPPTEPEGTSALSGSKDGITIQRDIGEPSAITKST